MIIENLGPGGHPDVCFHNGEIHCAWQDRETLNVRTPKGTTQYPLGSDVLAFPRVLSALGSFWVLYREGKSRGGHAVLLRDGEKVWESTFECGGNNPVALGLFGGGYVAVVVQAGTQQCFAYSLGFMSPAGVDFQQVPGTGIDRITPTRLVTWDSNFGSVAGMTDPSFAGNLIAGEHPTRGILVKDQSNNRQLHILPSEFTHSPNLAAHPNGTTFAVVVWGAGKATLVTFELNELTSPTAPYPPGEGWTRRDDIISINLAQFLFPENTIAVEGSHIPLDGVSTYTHLIQSQRFVSGIQIVKRLGNGLRSATFTKSADGSFWGLAWDATDGKNGYQIVIPNTNTTAPLYPSVMSVGEKHMRTVNVDILTPDGKRVNVNWRGYVEGVYNGPAMGSNPAGLYANIVWDFDDLSGYKEFNLCREGRGPCIWTEVKKSTGVTRRWIGVSNTTPITFPPVEKGTALPPGTALPLAPGVNIETYQKVVKNGWNGPLVEVRDRNNPDQFVVVEIINGSLHVYWRNAYGSNRSGLRRPIRFET